MLRSNTRSCADHVRNMMGKQLRRLAESSHDCGEDHVGIGIDFAL